MYLEYEISLDFGNADFGRYSGSIYRILNVKPRKHKFLLNYVPVDRGEMLSLRQLLVQPPEDLHDTEGRRGDGI